MRKTLATSIASLILLIGMASPAYALTISPARLEINGDPGATVTGEFEIMNEQEATKTFYTSSANFEAQGETGTPSFTSNTEGLASWISVAPQVVLTKGQKEKVPFTIVIPAGAGAGGHFAAIFLSTVPPGPDGGQVAVGAKIGMLVLLRVSGEITEGGAVTDFSTKNGGFFHTMLPVTYTYKFRNSGNDRVNPHGDVRILDTVRLTAAKLPANPSEGNVLPGSTRRFDVVWGPNSQTTPPSGFFNTVGYELKNFAFGFYTAKLDLQYGNSGRASGSKTIFVFPWQLTIVAVIILGILYLLFTQGLKRYNRWIIAQARASL